MKSASVPARLRNSLAALTDKCETSLEETSTSAARIPVISAASADERTRPEASVGMSRADYARLHRQPPLGPSRDLSPTLSGLYRHAEARLGRSACRPRWSIMPCMFLPGYPQRPPMSRCVRQVVPTGPSTVSMRRPG